MPRTTNRGSTALIAQAKPFSSNGSMKAIKDLTGAYVIYSYSTPIGIIRQETNQVFLNVQKYSQTTSRQQTHATLGLMEYSKLNGTELTECNGAEELTTAAKADRANYAR
jgi:hypothetical protein